MSLGFLRELVVYVVVVHCLSKIKDFLEEQRAVTYTCISQKLCKIERYGPIRTTNRK